MDSNSNNEISKEHNLKKIEFSFPIITIRTQKFNRIFDKIGSYKISKIFSWLSLVILPVIAGIGLYLLINSLINILWKPEIREIGRDLGPSLYLMLPGINPVLPIVYGWLAIIIAISIHEGSHAIVARNQGMTVKSSGLLLFLFVPIGAFVDVDEEDLLKSKPKKSLRVLAAGVGGNIVIAIICIIGLIVILNGLTPITDDLSGGVYVLEVIEDMPALEAGIKPNDIIVSINDQKISNFNELANTLKQKDPGDIINITIARGEKWDVYYSMKLMLAESENQAVMGVHLLDLNELVIDEQLDMYRNPTFSTLPIYLIPPALAPNAIPFSDLMSSFYTHNLGQIWIILANGLFWIWFVNINVAVFNALPIYPLDGGRMYDLVLKKVLNKKADKKTIFKITVVTTLSVVFILLSLVLIPLLT